MKEVKSLGKREGGLMGGRKEATDLTPGGRV